MGVINRPTGEAGLVRRGAGQRAWGHSGNERCGVTVRAWTGNEGIPTGMTRFLIFAAMAPPLGFVVAFWVMLQIANWLAGSPATFDVAQIMMLPTIYMVGLAPAFLVGWLDHMLAKREIPYRIALTAMFGYAITYLPLAVAFWIGVGHSPYVLLFGLIGAVPSAVCSWLATEGADPTLFRHHDRMRSSGRV
jgi:hypothetical protein